VFFIKNNQLITAPDQLVLSGITREKTIEIAKGLGIEILFRAVHCSELASFDACFITGTSPELLQVSSINKLTFTLNHPLYCMLKDEYIKLQIV
jgi:branched-chain amino acid aminotransferase